MSVKSALSTLTCVLVLNAIPIPCFAATVGEASDLRFLTDSALTHHGSWGEGTKDAAKEAYEVLQLAIGRLNAARRSGDLAYFTGAGTQYMKQEWPLFKAQAIAAVFDVQEHDAANAQIAAYRACQEASDAFSDLYQTYRSALLSDSDMSQAGLKEKVIPLAHKVERKQAACKQAL